MKHYKPRTLYFPKRLSERIEMVCDYPLTVVEAPSGFGKTTAIQHYFEDSRFSNLPVYWLTFLGESLSSAWNHFCKMICKIDPCAGEALLNLNTPNADDLREIEAIFSNLNCPEETYFILDNFGEFSYPALDGLLQCMASHGGKRLHIIVVMTQVSGEQELSVSRNHLVGYIPPSAFVFQFEDTKAYFQQVGLSLSDEDINRVQTNTEGWIFAIYLQMLSYLESGSFANGDMDALIQKSLWDRLGEQEQAFFLSLSVLHQFTLSQVQFITRCSQSVAEKYLLGNGFIHYDRENHSFYPHAIFAAFLKKQFYCLIPTRKKEIYLRCGEWAEQVYDRQDTLRFYYKAREFERIYALPMTSYDLADILDDTTEPMILDLLTETPKEIQYAHPRTLIPMAFSLFFMGRNETLVQMVPEMREVIEKSKLSQKEKKSLQGEIELLLSFLEYNRIDAMSARHRKALELIGGPATLISLKSTWTFGSPSVLFLFWRESGKLQEALRQMDQCMPVYYQLTRGHGSGAEFIMRAEAEFMRGNFVDAESLVHKALFYAESYRQNSIYQCGLFLLMRIAVLRGDAERLSNTMTMMTDRAFYNTEDLCRYTLDLTQSFLSLLAGKPEWMSDWIASGTFGNRLVVMALPFVHIIYGRVLIEQKEYQKLLENAEPFFQIASIFPNLLAQVYLLIYMAIAEYGTGNLKKAVSYLTQALSLSVPDEIYMPFAENGNALSHLLPMVVGYQDAISKIEPLSGLLTMGMRRLRGTSFKLTPREREIALLAKERLTNQEIAETLFLSEQTIKNTLTRIYDKLEIRSKKELKDLDF